MIISFLKKHHITNLQGDKTDTRIVLLVFMREARNN